MDARAHPMKPGATDRTDMPGVAWIDGSYVPLAEACVPILDRGFVRSDATYDVAHVWQGSFFRLHDHVERFFASMAALRFDLGMSRQEVADILLGCVSRSGLRDAYVQMTCTRGVPPRGTRDPSLCRNRFYAFAQPFVWIANEAQRRQGLRMVVSSIERIAPESIDPRVKNFHWLDLTQGIFEALDRGSEVPVLIDRNGSITEGPGFNVFVVEGGRLATPCHGVFEGMTRRTVFELCADLQLTCTGQGISPERLRRADEAFATSTAGGIMPITEVDGCPIGAGVPGPITERLRAHYWARQEEGWLATPVAYEAANPMAGGQA